MYTFERDRLQRLQELREAGINPYPHYLKTTHTLSDARELIGDREKAELETDETTVVVAGRIMFKRAMGKAGFAHIQDRSDKLQIYINKKVVGDEAFTSWKSCAMGDHIHITAKLMRTRTGEPTLNVIEFALSAKCISSMPDKHKGMTDIESRSRSRYVDLFMNEESKETFKRRSKAISLTRQFFEERAFMEVETPMMQTIPGGAAARPFTTHHNALDLTLYMRIAPELYLKRLVVGGFERVFEINRNFRNEGISTQHNPEFTMLEFYQAYATWEDLMNLTEELVRMLALEICGDTSVEYGDKTLDFGTSWKRLSYTEAISNATGLSETEVWNAENLRNFWIKHCPEDAKRKDLPKTVGKWFEHIFDELVESTLIQPTFLTHFPTEISPLSRRSEANPEIAERFELFIAGREIANGFNELNDPIDQAERFKAQSAAKDAGDDEAMFFDDDYIKALSYGMPPTAGEGIGIDRLVMLLTNAHSIREVILFPTLKPKPTEEKRSFYKQINGVRYSRRLLDWADEAIAGIGDGRISISDAKELLNLITADNRYSDLEKKTVDFIRKNYRWTEAGDAYLQGAIEAWIKQKSR